MFASKKATEKFCKNRNGVVTCGKKDFPWFVVVYDIYPTRFVFSIPLPRLKNKKKNTNRWIKIIYIPKSWEILYLSTQDP